jgi:hypothetical protein
LSLSAITSVLLSVIAVLAIAVTGVSLLAETRPANSYASNTPLATDGVDSVLASGSQVVQGASFRSPTLRNSTSDRGPVTDTCPGTSHNWAQYTAPGREFAIQYPRTTHPQRLSPDDPRLVSWTGFSFEQPFEYDTGNRGSHRGSVRFNVEISVWLNPNEQTAEAWAREHTNPRFVSDAGPSRVGNQEGYSLRESDLSSYHVRMFVAHSVSIYELTYMDVYTDNELFPAATNACWKAVLDKMVNSFTLF